MKFRELDDVIRLIGSVRKSCGEGSVCGRRLRKSERELLNWKKKGGPVPAGTMLRIVREIIQAVCEELLIKRPDERM